MPDPRLGGIGLPVISPFLTSLLFEGIRSTSNQALKRRMAAIQPATQ